MQHFILGPNKRYGVILKFKIICNFLTLAGEKSLKFVETGNNLTQNELQKHALYVVHNNCTCAFTLYLYWWYSHINPVHLGLEHGQRVAVSRVGHGLVLPGLYVEADDAAALPLTPVQHLPVGVVQGQSRHIGSGQFQQDFPVRSIEGGLLYCHTATVHPYHGAEIHIQISFYFASKYMFMSNFKGKSFTAFVTDIFRHSIYGRPPCLLVLSSKTSINEIFFH